MCGAQPDEGRAAWHRVVRRALRERWVCEGIGGDMVEDFEAVVVREGWKGGVGKSGFLVGGGQ